MNRDEPLAESLREVLVKAAALQRIVPGAVLVGGTAAAVHARHRLSSDHDHVVADLADRFDTILDHLEALDDWSMARAQQGKIILGELGGIETGLRQLRRRRPLETELVQVGTDTVVVPTAAETLRIKAWLAVTRNQVRDYVDIAALADHLGVVQAAAVLSSMDDFYGDLNERDEPVATQVALQLADPQPRDRRVITELSSYKQLDARWHEWKAVTGVCRDVAQAMLR